VFLAVQAKLKENKVFAKRNRKLEYLLSGQVYCACGRKRIGEGVKGHTYYRCTDRIYNFPLPRQCFNKGVSASVLDKLVWNNVINLLKNPDFIKEQAEKYTEGKENSQQVSQGEADQSKKQISKLQVEESRYLRAYTAGLISIEKLKYETTAIKQRIVDLQDKINLAKEPEPVKKLDLSGFDSFLDEEVVESWDFDNKQTLLRNLLLNINVKSQTEALVKGYLPLGNQVGKVGLCAESRYSRTPKCR
jgi:site-specific DNA recombinase